MSLLDQFDTMVSARVREFIRVGRITYSTTPVAGPNQRRTLGIHTQMADFELLVWDSGDVELVYGTVDSPHSEHVNISSEAELAALVERLLNLARAWPNPA